MYTQFKILNTILLNDVPMSPRQYNNAMSNDDF